MKEANLDSNSITLYSFFEHFVIVVFEQINKSASIDLHLPVFVHYAMLLGANGGFPLFVSANKRT